MELNVPAAGEPGQDGTGWPLAGRPEDAQGYWWPDTARSPAPPSWGPSAPGGPGGLGLGQAPGPATPGWGAPPGSPGQEEAGPTGPGWGGLAGDWGSPGWGPRRDESRQGRYQKSPPGRLRRAWRRFIGALAAIGAFLAKFGALLIKIKYVGLVISMLVSVLAYTLFFGWSFAVGFVLLIFVHEMGHVVVLRKQGVPASAPLFIPFLGAFVSMRQMPRDAYQEALSGLAGPYFGTAASLAVALWGHAVGSNFLLQLGAVGFLVNLFNLLPVLPLDGGRAAAALHPALWLLGLVALLAWEFYNPSPVALVILVLGGLELYRRWTRRNSPAAIAYHALSGRQRLVVAALYVLVVAVAMAGFQLTYVARSL